MRGWTNQFQSGASHDGERLFLNENPSCVVVDEIEVSGDLSTSPAMKTIGPTGLLQSCLGHPQYILACMQG